MSQLAKLARDIAELIQQHTYVCIPRNDLGKLKHY